MSYKLNEDFTIRIITAQNVLSIPVENQIVAPMVIGENKIQLDGKLIIVRLLMLETYDGLCYAIVPKNGTFLEDGGKYGIEIHNNFSVKEDKFKKISLSITSKNTYLDIVWPGLPGLETFKIDMDLSKYLYSYFIYNEMKKSYVKNCNENVQNSYQIIGQNFIDNMYNRSRVRNQNPRVPSPYVLLDT